MGRNAEGIAHVALFRGQQASKAKIFKRMHHDKACHVEITKYTINSSIVTVY